MSKSSEAILILLTSTLPFSARPSDVMSGRRTRVKIGFMCAEISCNNVLDVILAVDSIL
jgi:hypothetical protein